MVTLNGRIVTVPTGVVLDLGATAKAIAADRCAERVHRATGSGVLINLGGDIATAGPAPDGGWQVLVQDDADDPASRSRCRRVPRWPRRARFAVGGDAVRTSSTTSSTRGPGGRPIRCGAR